MGTKRKRDFQKRWDEYFTAITFAEAGEFDFAVDTIESKKKILVICPKKEMSHKSIKYIANFCERMKADLLFVGNCDSQFEAIKEFFKDKKTNIEYLPISTFSELDLLKLIEENRIKLIIVESLEILESIASLSKKEAFQLMEKILEKVHCPLVLLEEL